MRSIEIGEGQTLIDIAMQYCGDALRVFDVAELNGLQITDDLVPGEFLKVPDAEIDKEKITIEFSNYGLQPASRPDTFDEAGDEPEGIDYWAIDDDFIVQ